LHAGGQRFESVILHHFLEEEIKFFDILEEVINLRGNSSNDR
jgi:hypothetical protein